MGNLPTKKSVFHYSFWYIFVQNVRFDPDVKKCAIWRRKISVIHYSLWYIIVGNVQFSNKKFYFSFRKQNLNIWIIFENRKNINMTFWNSFCIETRITQNSDSNKIYGCEDFEYFANNTFLQNRIFWTNMSRKQKCISQWFFQGF